MYGELFRQPDVDALIACRCAPAPLPASAPPADASALGGWRRAWKGTPLWLAARALRDCPQDLRQALEFFVGAMPLATDKERHARLVHELLLRPERHADALELLRLKSELWPVVAVRGLFVFLSAPCSDRWWAEEAVDPIETAMMALRALFNDGAWRTDADALVKLRDVWKCAAETVGDRVAAEYAAQVRSCVDLSLGIKECAIAMAKMADEWRPRMPQIGEWFQCLGKCAREMPPRDDDPPCEVAVLIGVGGWCARYASRLSEQTLLRAAVLYHGDVWVAARAAAAVAFVDRRMLGDAASVFVLFASCARAARRVATVISSDGGKEAQSLWASAAVPISGAAVNLRTLHERIAGKELVDEALASQLRTFVDIGSFDEPTAVESFELQRRPDVTGPAVDALLRGSNVTGLTAAVTGMSGVGKSSAAVLVMNEVWDPSGALRSRFDNAKMILLGPNQENVRAGLVELMRFLTKREDVGSIDLGAASAGQRILVVLDDVCRTEDVEPFRALNKSCAILITTRNRDVIEAVRGAAIDVSLLSEDESAHWFTYYSGMTAALERARDAQRNRIGELVKRIAVGHCGRLPLAVRMVAAGVRRAAGGPSANLAQMAAQLSLELRELDKHGGDAHVPVQDDDEVVGGDAGWWRTMFNTLRLAVARAVADSPDREFGRMAYEVGLFAADADVPLRHLRFVWGVEEARAAAVVRRLVDGSVVASGADAGLRVHQLVRRVLRANLRAGVAARDVAKVMSDDFLGLDAWKSIDLKFDDGVRACLRKGMPVRPLDGGFQKNREMPLLVATRRCAHSAMGVLLDDRRVDVNSRSGGQLETALHVAVQLHDEKGVRLLLDRGADCRVEDLGGNVSFNESNRISLPLHGLIYSHEQRRGIAALPAQAQEMCAAVARGDEAEVRRLHEQCGVSVSLTETHFGDTLAHMAVRHGHVNVLAYLAGRGADLRARSKLDRPVLHDAVRWDQIKCVCWLTGPGRIGTNEVDGLGAGPILYARSAAIVDVLVMAGAVVDRPRFDGCTALITTAQKGFLDAVRRLIVLGANVNAQNERGLSALFLSAQNGHADVVPELLAVDGINLNIARCDGATPLLMSARSGYVDIVRLLLEKGGVDINVADDEGRSALSMSALFGHASIVRMLLERDGVEVDGRSPKGFTPLINASQNGHTAIVRMLIDAGANVDARVVGKQEENGFSGLWFASSDGHLEVARLLLDAGACPWYSNIQGLSAYSVALANGYSLIAKEILLRDSDPRDSIALVTDTTHISADSSAVGLDVRDDSGFSLVSCNDEWAGGTALAPLASSSAAVLYFEARVARRGRGPTALAPACAAIGIAAADADVFRLLGDSLHCSIGLRTDGKLHLCNGTYETFLAWDTEPATVGCGVRGSDGGVFFVVGGRFFPTRYVVAHPAYAAVSVRGGYSLRVDLRATLPPCARAGLESTSWRPAMSLVDLG